MTPVNNGLWFAIWTQTDMIGQALFLILVAMSCATWYLIFYKSFSTLQIGGRTKRFLKMFRDAPSLTHVADELSAHGTHEPFGHLASHAFALQRHHSASKIDDLVTRAMRRVIDHETSKLENGLTILATIGATAPFVGLFGTVWGVYHALMAIAADAGASFANLAGPVGEALIMTGLGLAVAIPAVLAYNTLVRRNRVYLARLDGFAHELFACITTGQFITPIDSTFTKQALNHEGV